MNPSVAPPRAGQADEPNTTLTLLPPDHAPAWRVRECMVATPPCVTDAAPVGAALRTLGEEGLLGVPCVNDGELKGTVTAAALLEQLGAVYQRAGASDTLLDVLDAPIADLLPQPTDDAAEVPRCTDSDSLSEACRIMTREGLAALPVTRRGDLVGVLNATDVVRAVADLDRPLFPSTAPHTVAEWMTRRVLAVDPDDSVADALDDMAIEGVRHLLVLDHGRLCGVISNGDVLRSAKCTRGRKLELDLHRCTVREVMTPAPLHTIWPAAPLSVAAARMSCHRVNMLPVLEDERVVGVLSTRDLMAALCICQ